MLWGAGVTALSFRNAKAFVQCFWRATMTPGHAGCAAALEAAPECDGKLAVTCSLTLELLCLRAQWER